MDRSGTGSGERRGRIRLSLFLLHALALAAVGCTPSAMRTQSPEDFERELADVRLVGDVSVPFGIHPLVVESVGLVVNLPNTGGDMPPSNERAMIISELQRHSVERPNEVLTSTTTSPVIVRAALRPGLEKGDRYDIEAVVPQACGTTSLAGGYLLDARMSEMQALGNRLHKGHVMGLARGSLLVDPLADQDHDPGALRHARIIEGGVALRSRPFGLLLKPDEKSFRNSAQIGTSVNQRFHMQRHGIKTGVATPKTDGYIELLVHPRYKDNILRYFQVIRSLPLVESPTQRQVRLKLLERQLLDAVTSAAAALRLEAIGDQGRPVLKKGIASSDAEVRFYAAEALAYLDDAAAAGPLAAAARDESAFRARAFAALSVMDDPAAYDELVTLLDTTSAETRYGAFRALWAMNPRDPLVRAESVADRFSLHHVTSKGPVMIHVTRAYRPEIVVFGPEPKLRTPLILNAGKNIVVRDVEGNQVAVTRFAPGVPDQKRNVSPSLLEVVRAIAEIGGTYPDVVQALSQAKTSGAIACRFEVDALPRTDRMYVRPSGPSSVEQQDEQQAAPREPEGFPVDSPAPNLFPAADVNTSGDDRTAEGRRAAQSLAPKLPESSGSNDDEHPRAVDVNMGFEPAVSPPAGEADPDAADGGAADRGGDEPNRDSPPARDPGKMDKRPRAPEGEEP